MSDRAALLVELVEISTWQRTYDAHDTEVAERARDIRTELERTAR